MHCREIIRGVVCFVLLRWYIFTGLILVNVLTLTSLLAACLGFCLNESAKP